jgi:hypothetical protein
MHNKNHLCVHCLITTKQNTVCGECGQPTLEISDRARVPKKDANKKEWKSLFDEFPHILKNAAKSKALIKMGFQ